MIKLKGTILFLIITLLGCQKEVPKEEPGLYSSEQEKILNETFLEIVGTGLYYKIEDKYFDKAIEISNAQGEEAGRRYYDKHKVEDTARLVIFTRNKFVSSIYINNRFADTLNPDLLPIIRNSLIENNFPESKVNAILDTLSIPFKICSVNLRQSGRYELIPGEYDTELAGSYKAYGTFNISRIYIDSTGENACLFYERQFHLGKSAFGALVLFKKIGSTWKLTKEIVIYQT